MLVGIGLADIKEIPSHVQSVAAFVAMRMGEGAQSEAMAGSVVVGFTVCGFLCVYLWTRLYMRRELRIADESAGEIRALRWALTTGTGRGDVDEIKTAIQTIKEDMRTRGPQDSPGDSGSAGDAPSSNPKSKK